MSEAMSNLEKKIAEFQELLEEMKQERRAAHEALRDVRREKREIERLLSDDVRKMVRDRTDEIVTKELEKIGPTIREQTNLIYERVGNQIDKLIDISMGPEFGAAHGREDLRPALATMLKQWIRQVLDEEGYRLQ